MTENGAWAAGIPAIRGFKAKPELAMDMLARALDAVPARWVTGDAVYGQYYKLRKALEDRGVFYVRAVPMNQRVIAKTTASVPGGQWLADELIASLPATAWWTRSAGHGSKGDRRYAWARARISGTRDPEAEYWLLARRSLADKAESLLPDPRTQTSCTGRPRPGRRSTVGNRGDLPDQQRPDQTTVRNSRGSPNGIGIRSAARMSVVRSITVRGGAGRWH